MAQVLVATATWETEAGTLAMRPECEESVAMQAFEGGFDRLISTENPFPPPSTRNVYHQYLRIRDLFLAGPWDALLMVEHDNRLPDAGALERMYGTAADVVYAPYVLRHGMRVLSTWKHLGPEYTNLGSSVSNDDAFVERAREAVVYPVSGVGFGCTLVRRAVLERVPFRAWTPGVLSAPDIPFAEDCLRAGIAPVGRFDVPVEHWDSGEWIHPYRSTVNREYVALVTANAYAGEEQRFISLVEGNRYPLPYDVAWDLARRGLVKEVWADVPETAAVEPAERAVRPRARKRVSGGR